LGVLRDQCCRCAEFRDLDCRLRPMSVIGISRRLTRTDEVCVICPTGKSVRVRFVFCPVSFEKIFRIFRNRKSVYVFTVLSHKGALAIVTDAGRDAVDAAAQPDERHQCVRRNRVVLMPRRWHQVSDNAYALRLTTVANKPGHRGERAISRKTIARGMPGVSGVTVVTTLVCFFISHTRLRAHPAPGIPCAL
jgi:hypothetical protein